MKIPDIYGAIISATFLGGLAFAVLTHGLKNSRRAAVIRWCYLVGTASVGMLVYFATLSIKPLPKSTIGIIFVGLPALVCGLLLSAQDLISRARNGKNQT